MSCSEGETLSYISSDLDDQVFYYKIYWICETHNKIYSFKLSLEDAIKLNFSGSSFWRLNSPEKPCKKKEFFHLKKEACQCNYIGYRSFTSDDLILENTLNSFLYTKKEIDNSKSVN